MVRSIIAGAGLLCVVAGAGMAQDAAVDAGRVEYLSACAGCHGQDARGDGPMADLLKISTPDLTKLTERAGGEFPFRNTLMLIDGREVRAHGGGMPVWGDRYMTMAKRAEAGTETPESISLVAQGRLLALVSYLETIQQ